MSQTTTPRPPSTIVADPTRAEVARMFEEMANTLAACPDPSIARNVRLVCASVASAIDLGLEAELAALVYRGYFDPILRSMAAANPEWPGADRVLREAGMASPAAPPVSSSN